MTKTASLFIILSISVLTLVLGRNLLIPFVFALLIWLLMRKFREIFDILPFFRKWLPAWIKTVLSSVLLLFIVVLLGKVVESNVQELAKSYVNYQQNISGLLKSAEYILPSDMRQYMETLSTGEILGKSIAALLSGLQYILGNAFVILLYVLFILLEESSFSLKLKELFKKNSHYEQSKGIFDEIERSVTNYIGLKSLIALIAGTLSYFVLLIIGIDAPLFWALLISLLNFIPTIGALVGTLFPMTFAFIQFGQFTPGLLILLFVGIIQVLVGNVLEPKLMGNSLNVSPLATIFALSFWGAIWGITGMFLSVPITVIMVIVFSKFNETRSVAILLSEKGVIDSQTKP